MAQLVAPLPAVPWSRMTGRGLDGDGRHDQSLAPSSTDPGAVIAFTAPLRKVCGTGNGSRLLGSVVSARAASVSAGTNSARRRLINPARR